MAKRASTSSRPLVWEPTPREYQQVLSALRGSPLLHKRLQATRCKSIEKLARHVAGLKAALALKGRVAWESHLSSADHYMRSARERKQAATVLRNAALVIEKTGPALLERGMLKKRNAWMVGSTRAGLKLLRKLLLAAPDLRLAVPGARAHGMNVGQAWVARRLYDFLGGRPHGLVAQIMNEVWGWDIQSRQTKYVVAHH